MEPNLSLYEDKLQFYLVAASEESQLSSHMEVAREKLDGYICTANIKIVTTTECMRVSGNFTRKHVVIFDDFQGDCFEAIQKTPALILGPKCVISCLMDNVTLPDINSPMYGLSMRNLIVCLSSFDAQEKAKLRKFIGYMGGLCIDQLAGSVTHLVTESVRTKKYDVAVMQNMQIMKASWVYKVWDDNLDDNVLATNEKYNTHKVPTFYKLRVTTTGLNRIEKKEVEELVKKGGGSHFGEFTSSGIDLVIAKRKATETPKLKAALSQRKDCLCVEWIKDSAKKGIALPIESYRIDLQAKHHSSTPEKRPSGNQLHNTQASGIDISNIPFTSTVDESAMSNLSINSDQGFGNGKRKSSEAANENMDLSYKATFDKLNIQEVKRAGSFLDGCSIFICGFTTDEKEKIVKILNAGGATRYDTIHSNLSHILVGGPSRKDIKMLQAVKSDAVLVKLDWLLESISKKVAVDCNNFVYHMNKGKSNAILDEHPTTASPASKRNILLMSGQTKQGTPKHLNFNDTNSIMAEDESPNDRSQIAVVVNKERAEDEIIDQYLKAPAQMPTMTPSPNTAEPSREPIAGPSKNKSVIEFKEPAALESENFDSDSDFSSTISTPVLFLARHKVYLGKFEQSSYDSLVEDCKQAGADVIDDDNYKGIVDFLILPVDAMNMDGITIKAKTVVNHNWLINAKRLHQIDVTTNLVAIADTAQIPYFYKPIFFPDELLPLANMVIVFSLYSSDEREFLWQLALILGADTQETYSRSNRPVLICSEAKSAKYEAAIRWRLPVVNRHWLLECYKLQRRIPLRNYLVGESIAPVEEDEDDEILSSQPVARIETKDTAVLPHRRIEQLGGAKAGGSKACPDSPLTPARNAALTMLDTPTRNSLLRRFKELEDETPQSKRRRFEEAGIHTPECATTPYWQEFKRQQIEEQRTRHAPTQEQIEKIQNRTPWSEITRRLWKEALGDEYESPSQCYRANLQPEPPNVLPDKNDNAFGRPAPRQLEYESPAETEADENIQMLADFISKGKRENNECVQYADLPNTAPLESELINTEQHEVIGWRDPSEDVADTPKRTSKPKNVPCFSISCSNDIVKNKIIKQIHSLSGKVCENLVNYDSSCTHFICEKPSRSEKMLSCVAAGKWVLGLKYIEKSFDAKRFLDEEEFEWGNPKAMNLPTIESNDLLIAKAAFRWRKKLQSVMIPSAKGIFKDFRVILKTGKNESLRTLIEAGRGKIIETNKDLSLDQQMPVLTEVTHIICQARYADFTANELKALEQSNVLPVGVNYLQSFIISETIPDVNNFLFKTSKS